MVFLKVQATIFYGGKEVCLERRVNVVPGCIYPQGDEEILHQVLDCTSIVEVLHGKCTER